MAGCRKEIKVHVESKWDYKEITVRCGNTSPSGNPFLCEDCEKKYSNVNWEREARLNGEAWGPEDY